MTLLEIQEKIRKMPLNIMLQDTAMSIEFKNLYSKVFPGNDLCSTCPGSLEGAYNKILNMEAKKNTHVGKYILKGVLEFMSPIKGVPHVVSQENLTNEMGDKILAHNDNYKTQLLLNENWRPENYVPTVNEAEEHKTDELENIKSAFTNAQLRKMLTDKGINFDPNSNKQKLAETLFANK